jgi:hypothetical protein
MMNAAMAPAGTRASNGDPDGPESLLGLRDNHATQVHVGSASH